MNASSPFNDPLVNQSTAPTSGRILVSIPLCTYNGETHLRRQMDSLLSQDYPDIEIVASDDASKDGSAQVLHEYAALDRRVSVVVNSSNIGFSANFESAINRCTGDYICPSDQDDVWAPNKISRLLESLGDSDMVYCDSEMIDIAEAPMRKRMSQVRGMYAGKDPLALVITNSASGHAMLFRRSVLCRANPFPKQMYYDWWITIVAATGNGVSYLDEPLVKFRRHKDNVTTFGRPGSSATFDLEGFLRERLLILEQMLHLESYRYHDIARLRDAAQVWLDEKRKFPLLREVWRHLSPLTFILRPRVLQVAGKSLGLLRRTPRD